MKVTSRKLVAEAATGTAAGGGAGNTRTLSYDSLSRPNGSTLTQTGSTATYANAYNSDGRLDTVTYPSGFVAKHVYTAAGFLSQIKDNASGAVLYTVNTRDQEDHLTQATLGNGVVENDTYDVDTGRLTSASSTPTPASTTRRWRGSSARTIRSRTRQTYRIGIRTRM